MLTSRTGRLGPLRSVYRPRAIRQETGILTRRGNIQRGAVKAEKESVYKIERERERERERDREREGEREREKEDRVYECVRKRECVCEKPSCNTRANVVATVISSQVSPLLILQPRKFANLQTVSAAIDLVSSSTYRTAAIQTAVYPAR